MGEIGKHTYLRLMELFQLQFLLLFELQFTLQLLLLRYIIHDECHYKDKSNGIKQVSIPGFPQGWMHNDAYLTCLLTPDSIIIRSLHFKYIGSRT